MRSHKELMQLNLDQDWTINSILPRGGILMVAGQPKVGKSLLVMDMCHALGNPKVEFFHGFGIEQRGPVLYINLDMPPGSHRRRFERLELNHHFNFGNLWHITRDELPTAFNLLNEGPKKWLLAQVSKLKPTVIVFDVIRRFYTGDENSSDIAAQFMQVVNELMQEGGSSAILVHHTNKTSEMSKNMGFDKDPINAVRGSSVIAGSVDTIAAFNDIGNELAYQGRDLNLKYSITRAATGLHNRWIKEKAGGRTAAIERLIARFLLQKPELGPDHLYTLCSPHIEAADYTEFKARHKAVIGNLESYEWS